MPYSSFQRLENLILLIVKIVEELLMMLNKWKSALIIYDECSCGFDRVHFKPQTSKMENFVYVVLYCKSLHGGSQVWKKEECVRQSTVNVKFCQIFSVIAMLGCCP